MPDYNPYADMRSTNCQIGNAPVQVGFKFKFFKSGGDGDV
jgi:hypothetical protein